MSATITWGDLQPGHKIVGGWVVTELTATHISVVDELDQAHTFARKDPWESVEIETMDVSSVVESFGGHLIREDVVGQAPTFFNWPDDEAFRTAAQSHLAREHQVDAEARSYVELKMLHEALHESGDNDHDHVPRP